MARITTLALASAFAFSLPQAVLSTSVQALSTNKEAAATEENQPFKPSADQMGDVTATLERAKSAGKLGLVILGANWCHDSRALISRFDDPALQQILSKHYETVLVDVGELAHGKDVIQRFGMPVIYGTPTVLIIDPASEQQINRDGMHIWRNAYQIDQEETNAYFKGFAEREQKQTSAEDTSADLEKLLAEIDAFEATQAERIYAGFGLIGPMITMDRDERPENFASLWNELRDFRYQITEDLKALRTEAQEKAQAGSASTPLSFPEYPAFSWEK